MLARAALGAIVMLGLSEMNALAFPGGIFDVARPEAGCSCHGLPETRNTATQLVVDGLPESYTPGAAYELTIWVIGVPLPTGAPLGSALRGFNLQVTAGELRARAGDSTLQTRMSSECDLARAVSACGTAGKPACAIDGAELCDTMFECYERRCTTPGTGSCRACSGAIVDIQATHTNVEGALDDPVTAYTADGNSVLNWTLGWVAPQPGAGPVTFYLAGNVVNSNGGADPGDVWSVLDPGIVVPEAP